MPTALAAGQLVDERYALDHELFEDALGTTWEAFDRGLGRTVFLRDLTFPGDGPHDARLRHALKTARMAIRVDHPRAVHVYDAFIDGDRLVIVTELSYTRSLHTRITRKGPLPPKRVAAIGLELLGPLAAAHAIGATHGAIDPWAVLVPDKAGRGSATVATALLTGLGLAPPFTDSADLEWVEAIGTPACVAPEQVEGRGTSPASDLWALGATLYYAVEGDHAFDADTPAETFAAITETEPRPPSRAQQLWPVLEPMLAKDPEARPALDQLRRDLADVAGLPLDGDGAAMVERRRRRWARRPAAEDASGDVEVDEGVDGEEVADGGGAPDVIADGGGTPDVIADEDHDWDSVLRDATPDAGVDGSHGAEAAEAAEAADGEDAPADADAQHAPATALSPEEDKERQFRATPSWPPPQQQRPLLVILLCAWVVVVLVGLLATNGHLARPKATKDSAANRPVLEVDPATVPRDWITYHHPTVDFGVSYPPGWRLREEGPQLTITDPVSGTELRVDARTPPGSDPDRAALEAERTFSGRHPRDYQRLQMSPATYLGHPAALWEYSYAERGRTAHAAELGFNTKRYHFSMLFQADDDAWQDLLPTFRGFLNSVRAPK